MTTGTEIIVAGAQIPIRTSADIATVVRDLAPLERDVLSLVYFGGYTQLRASRMLNVPREEVAAAAARGLRALATHLMSEADKPSRARPAA
jgi:DNA-directed RNA polymerase specialized sigma24 family protein